jgi:hypothetical protein
MRDPPGLSRRAAPGIAGVAYNNEYKKRAFGS